MPAAASRLRKPLTGRPLSQHCAKDGTTLFAPVPVAHTAVFVFFGGRPPLTAVGSTTTAGCHFELELCSPPCFLGGAHLGFMLRECSPSVLGQGEAKH